MAEERISESVNRNIQNPNAKKKKKKKAEENRKEKKKKEKPRKKDNKIFNICITEIPKGEERMEYKTIRSNNDLEFTKINV